MKLDYERSLFIGISGRIRLESAVGFDWNRWSDSIGIGGRFGVDYAHDVVFVQQVAAQLPWFHIVTILEQVKGQEERAFYMLQAAEHGWSRNVLSHQIDTNLFSRQGKTISNFKDKLPSHQYELTQQTLKDPYIFDFLGIGNEAHERELESSLIRHMEKFLVELGSGFAFVGRQYRLEVGGDDFYIDLLMYPKVPEFYIPGKFL